MGYGPWGHKESDTAEQPTLLHFHNINHIERDRSPRNSEGSHAEEMVSAASAPGGSATPSLNFRAAQSQDH